MSDDEALAVAAAAGQQLAAAFAEAKAASADWQDFVLARRMVGEAIDASLVHLAATGRWGSDNRLPSVAYWEATSSWLHVGAMLYRARTKPRGYAGDDEMLRRIGIDWRCEHPLGRVLDDYFQSQSAPKAVRNRMQLVADALVAELRSSNRPAFHVVSVGSGPALDIVWALEQLRVSDRSRLRVTLLDLDPQALEDAGQRLRQFLTPEQVSLQRENLYRLAMRPHAEELLRGDFLFCTGFFDYLSDAAACDLLRVFWKSLSPAGRMMVFNFAPQNDSRALMEWIGNWYLIYRDRQAMEALAASAGIETGTFAVGAEAEGIDLFIDARR